MKLPDERTPAAIERWIQNLLARARYYEAVPAPVRDLIPRLYHAGIVAGIILGLHAARANRLPLPIPVSSPDGTAARAWARGVAATMNLPPATAFARRRRPAEAIYRAALEEGLRWTLKHLRVVGAHGHAPEESQ